MNCQEVRIKLNEYLDGELKSEETRQVRKHLRFCRKCFREFSFFRQTARLIRKLPYFGPSPLFTQRILKDLGFEFVLEPLWKRILKPVFVGLLAITGAWFLLILVNLTSLVNWKNLLALIRFLQDIPPVYNTLTFSAKIITLTLQSITPPLYLTTFICAILFSIFILRNLTPQPKGGVNAVSEFQ
ncbi:MAG: zf-HC2 domain-containing protein [Candidatus Edwardsbacteria bacterium]